MNLLLHRSKLTDTETQGVLTVGGSIFFTIEQPWEDNKEGHSCVPSGFTYQLIPFDSPKHGPTWFLYCPEAHIYGFKHGEAPAGYEQYEAPADDPLARIVCEIHPANWAFQLEGCIAPGMGKADSSHGPMVTQSRIAFQRIQALLGIGSTGHTLEITQ